MPRHRGKYNPENETPYEISRSQIESFLKCPACFWMNRVKGIKFPGMPGFLLNTATDTLLKKDFDVYRELEQPHPFMASHGLDDLVPFKHEDFELWTKSLQLGFRTDYEQCNFIVGGGLDDVWQNTKTGELHIVDYKSTASAKNTEGTALKEITLDGNYKQAYKRQMDMYVWILRRKGFEVSNKGYFVYVNGDQHFENGMLVNNKSKAKMMFDVQLIEYESDDSWVEETIKSVKTCLDSSSCPDHSQMGLGPKGDKPCEVSVLLQGIKDNNL